MNWLVCRRLSDIISKISKTFDMQKKTFINEKVQGFMHHGQILNNFGIRKK